MILTNSSNHPQHEISDSSNPHDRHDERNWQTEVILIRVGYRQCEEGIDGKEKDGFCLKRVKYYQVIMRILKLETGGKCVDKNKFFN